MKFLYDPIVGLNHIPSPPGVVFTQGFGQHLMDYSPFIGHNGHDYAAPLGTPVHAMCDGWIVEATAKETGYGLRLTQWVEIDGREFDITYGHFQKVNYPDIPWQYKLKTHPVKAGEVIGYVNSSGRSTGNHLHITLREWGNGTVLNPGNGYGGAIDPTPYMFNQDPPMNQAKIVKSKKSPSIYVCYEMPDMDYLQKKANIEGFTIPANVPDTDSL